MENEKESPQAQSFDSDDATAENPSGDVKTVEAKQAKEEPDEKPDMFVFEEGTGKASKPIPLDFLSRSIRRESGLRGLKDIPVQFWRIYRFIMLLLDEYNVNYTEASAYVQNNSSKAYLTDADEGMGYTQKNAPMEKWRFDKVISTIQLPGIVKSQAEGDIPLADERNAAIGLTLNKEGLSIAFGMHVWACDNFNVMGGTIIRSFKKESIEGLSWEIMQQRLGSWIKNLKPIWNIHNEIMDEMKNHTLDSSDLDEPIGIIEKVIGELYIGAINQAYFNGPLVPFNSYELSDFVQESIRQRRDEEKISNVWDLYNWGTSIMIPGKVDIGDISESSNTWSEYLINEFNLQVPKPITPNGYEFLQENE